MSYDPVYAKQQMNEPVSSNSTPVAAYSVSAAPTIAAAPVTAQPGYYPHQNTPNRQAYSVRPPPGHWGDNICDWPKNLFPSCWCTCCCCYGMWLSAQSKATLPIYNNYCICNSVSFCDFSWSESWIF